jgi:hypothetical protein
VSGDVAEREFAAAWQRQPKAIASRTLASVGPNATLIRGDLDAFVRDLKATVDGELEVAGTELAAAWTCVSYGHQRETSRISPASASISSGPASSRKTGASAVIASRSSPRVRACVNGETFPSRSDSDPITTACVVTW